MTEYLLETKAENVEMIPIAVLIPCYNEEKTITKVISDFEQELPNAVVYVYDNNSTDETAMQARLAGAIVRSEHKQGKGNVIRRMFREIDAECYSLVDGDDTYPAESATVMVKDVLENQADMVVGDRLSLTYFEENKRIFHGFGNLLVKKCINILFNNDIKDIMTGYRAFSYEFVKTFPVLSTGFEIETEMSVHAVDKRMQIASIPVEYRDRPKGSVSKLRTYSDGIRILVAMIRLFKNYHPLKFFGAISAALTFLVAWFMIPVMITYRNTGLVPQFPTLIVCGFTMVAALQSIFAGIELQTILQKNRQDFELELIRAHNDKIIKMMNRVKTK